jgi:Wyosine base formation
VTFYFLHLCFSFSLFHSHSLSHTYSYSSSPALSLVLFFSLTHTPTLTSLLLSSPYKLDFIEIKSVTYCGKSDASSLTMENVPWHHECCQFSEAIANRYAPKLTIENYTVMKEFFETKKNEFYNTAWHHIALYSILLYFIIAYCVLLSFSFLFFAIQHLAPSVLFAPYLSFLRLSHHLPPTLCIPLILLHSSGWQREGTALDTP